jgi:hypothetical protein
MFTFLVSASALFLIALTMFMRLNDQRCKPGLRWNVRLLGFVLAGCAPIGVVWNQWATGLFPNVYETIFHVGLALVFMTTPGQHRG